MADSEPNLCMLSNSL